MTSGISKSANKFTDYMKGAPNRAERIDKSTFSGSRDLVMDELDLYIRSQITKKDPYLPQL